MIGGNIFFCWLGGINPLHCHDSVAKLVCRPTLLNISNAALYEYDSRLGGDILLAGSRILTRSAFLSGKHGQYHN